jgi:hypothetical protein
MVLGEHRRGEEALQTNSFRVGVPVGQQPHRVVADQGLQDGQHLVVKVDASESSLQVVVV